MRLSVAKKLWNRISKRVFNTSDPVLRSIVGDNTKELVIPESALSVDFDQGAIANEIEYTLQRIRQYEEEFDINNATESRLDVYGDIFNFFRLATEGDVSFRERLLLELDTKIGTKQEVLDHLQQFFYHPIYIREADHDCMWLDTFFYDEVAIEGYDDDTSMAIFTTGECICPWDEALSIDPPESCASFYFEMWFKNGDDCELLDHDVDWFFDVVFFDVDYYFGRRYGLLYDESVIVTAIDNLVPVGVYYNLIPY